MLDWDWFVRAGEVDEEVTQPQGAPTREYDGSERVIDGDVVDEWRDLGSREGRGTGVGVGG